MRPLVHIVGARPNFVKAASVHAALAARGVHQRLVHTGQHYDAHLSDVFFTQLGIPEPDVDLGVGSGTHGVQTARLLEALEREFLARPPAVVVVYGDVNSTLAAALVCAKQHVPLAHVEAGLRSFDRSMPEEVNRVLTDAVSDLLFVTSPEAIAHLADEGVDHERIRFVGNPMIDTLDANRDRLDPDAARRQLGIDGPYAVATVHRPANVDDPVAARQLVSALSDVSRLVPLVIPLHPRGRQTMTTAGLVSSDSLHVIEPLGYLEFNSLVAGAALVLTDSGGVQEETTVLGVPCLTVRSTTERPITIDHGTNRLVSPDELSRAVADVLASPPEHAERPPFWDGRAGDRIAVELERFLAR